MPVEFTSLTVAFNHEVLSECLTLSTITYIDIFFQEYNDLCRSEDSFILNPGEPFLKIFKFYYLLKHVNSTLQVTDVKLTMGSDPNIVLNLSWVNGTSLFLLPLDNSPFGTPLPTNWENFNYELVPCMNICNLKRREAKVQLNVEHEKPCLVNEFYPLDVTIRSSETDTMCDVK